MGLQPDKHLRVNGDTEDDRRDFRIAQLNRRVENLEAIVFELLRDKVHYELIDGYLTTIESKNTFTPSSSDLKDRGSQFASLSRQGFPPENLNWPEEPVKWPRQPNK
ncbi:hypothetical protein E0H35_36415 [Rhizobium leguminosarum bv. viciae]|uniref:hypothetical protein n=1 Tax=Rhizobium TaxID=379 RepID=UPI00037D9A78|nr:MULTISPECIES: hypothetical protein [Rhizobium]MBY3207045.1 hypothetical protein [Rhizobium laguerreae]MBY5343673.1 hypothetical protein [Rhizobium leguminosarum]MBY5533009.1 hypothetical protein [Rhizobium leguminosarum]MBY5594050.1 hypothetical protein [Rhizobium leguminosarum]MBY5728910.1 hypothetical protein [Rhizobium leguminosarum]